MSFTETPGGGIPVATGFRIAATDQVKGLPVGSIILANPDKHSVHHQPGQSGLPVLPGRPPNRSAGLRLLNGNCGHLSPAVEKVK